MSQSDSLDATEKEIPLTEDSEQNHSGDDMIHNEAIEATGTTKSEGAEEMTEASSTAENKSAKKMIEANGTTKSESAEEMTEASSTAENKSAKEKTESNGTAKSESAEEVTEASGSAESESAKKMFTEASLPKDYEGYLKKIEEMTTPEMKLHLTMEFMEYSLSQSGCPNFKNFWESRKICLELFKENIPTTLRFTFWNKYRDLSKEARNLKALLDEQSAFAIEQIEIAIGALEGDVGQLDVLLQQHPPAFENIQCRIMEKQFDNYNLLQKELNLLNAQATRINGLRKELIKTEMRVRFKNKFFQRLSTAGDLVFPRRKELIKEVSQRFNEDVDQFVEQYFGDDFAIDGRIYDLRDEIKSLQGVAKLLTLNTQAFNQTRMKLSGCWDKIKRLEKDRKKERAEKKGLYQANAETVQTKIDAAAESFKSGKSNIVTAQQEVGEIFTFMRGVELGKDEVKQLKDQLHSLQKVIHQKENEAENEKKQKELEKERHRQEQVQKIKDDFDEFLTNVQDFDVDQVEQKRDSFCDQIQNSPLTKFERQNLERLLRPIKDIIADKKEQALSNLSDDEKKVMGHLKELLNERLERSKEIKEQIEVFRKTQGASVSDFQKAMSYNQQLSTEKERLEKVNQGISEIQQKIAALEETHK